MKPGNEIGKSARDGLREDIAFLNDVLDCIQDGISILDSDLNILFINQSMEKWYAHQLPIMGKKCYEAYHGREEPCEICPSIQTLKSGKQTMEVVPFTGAEGIKGWLELFTFPLKDSKTGRMIGVIEYVRDITERKRAEEAWRESEERFRRLSEASFEGIVIHDGKMILAANQAFAKMFGHELSDVAGMSVPDLVLPEYRDSLLKKDVPHEMVCLKKDGTEFICKVHGKEIPYQGLKAKVSAIRDITERKRAEEKLKMYAEDLQRSNLELEEYAAIVSHDLQSPLISVLSVLRLLEKHSRGSLDFQADEYLTMVKDRITNMIEVIRSMLEYSRVGTSYKFELTDLETVLDRSIANLMADIVENGATVIHDPLPSVMGDAMLLSQVFQNLISNAIKFQGEGPPQVHVSAERKEREWIFSIRDNGIGIAAEDTGHIFDIFHSLKSKGEYHSTGIGLATCKKAVELHGGRIWVESEPGKGSTFHYTIPDREGDQS